MHYLVYVAVVSTGFGCMANQSLAAKAHVHGIAEMAIAVDGQKVQLEFELPAMDIFGFEHKAKNKAQQQIVSTELNRIDSNAKKLAKWPAAKNCSITNQSVSSPLSVNVDKTTTVTSNEDQDHTHHSSEAQPVTEAKTHHRDHPAKPGSQISHQTEHQSEKDHSTAEKSASQTDHSTTQAGQTSQHDDDHRASDHHVEDDIHSEVRVALAYQCKTALAQGDLVKIDTGVVAPKLKRTKVTVLTSTGQSSQTVDKSSFDLTL